MKSIRMLTAFAMVTTALNVTVAYGDTDRRIRPRPRPRPIPVKPAEVKGNFFRAKVHLSGHRARPVALRKLLGLGPKFRGKEVGYVVVKGSSRSGRGDARLLVNGQPFGPAKTLDRWDGTKVFLVSGDGAWDRARRPRRPLRLGREIHTLALEIRGASAVVNEVGLKLGDAFNPIHLTKKIDRRIGGSTVLPLRALLQIDDLFKNLSLRNIRFKAHSVGGHGQARLLVNDNVASRTVLIGREHEPRVIKPHFPRQAFEREIFKLGLDLFGRIGVTHVTAVVESHLGKRLRPVPGPRPVPRPRPRPRPLP
jgi:hypothetical protein